MACVSRTWLPAWGHPALLGTGTGLGAPHSPAELMLLYGNCLFPDFTVFFPWGKQILVFLWVYPVVGRSQGLVPGLCQQLAAGTGAPVGIPRQIFAREGSSLVGGSRTHVLPWDR